MSFNVLDRHMSRSLGLQDGVLGDVNRLEAPRQNLDGGKACWIPMSDLPTRIAFGLWGFAERVSGRYGIGSCAVPMREGFWSL